MLYLKKLEISDENDNIIFRLNSKKAIEGLKEAMLFVYQKDRSVKKLKRKEQNLKSSFWDQLDKEFKDYFNLRSGGIL